MKSAKNLLPEAIAKQGLARLKAQADPEKAAQAQKYFKEVIQSFGLPARAVHDLARELYLTVKSSWEPDEALNLCEILLPNPHLEAKALAILILTRFRKALPQAAFFRVKDWLQKNYCDNWATVDTLCPDVAGSLLEKYPDLLNEIKLWPSSDNRWVRRASAVSFIKLARRKNYLDEIYQISETLFSDQDDLIQKANGWLLREAGKADMGRLEKFLLRHGPRFPRTTLRYAIERFPKEKRQALLLRNRPSQP